MLPIREVTSSDIGELTVLLRNADLTLSGLDDPRVRLWLLCDVTGVLIASMGFEPSESGADVIVRSVAVAAAARGVGVGSAVAQHAIERARDSGATRAWLFSRRSGPFWQAQGFEPADRDELAERLATTHQVRLFRSTGQLEREVAWSRAL